MSGEESGVQADLTSESSGPSPVPESACDSCDRATLSSLAVSLTGRDPDVDSDALRLVIQAVDDYWQLANPADLARFFAEPAPTGDPRWDAFLAGLAVHLIRQRGLPTTPAWTRSETRYVIPIWWWGEPSLAAYNLQRTPASMRCRGVIFNADNLVSL